MTGALDGAAAEGIWDFQLRSYLAEFRFEQPAGLDRLDAEVRALIAEPPAARSARRGPRRSAGSCAARRVGRRLRELPVARTGRADFVVSEGSAPVAVYDAKYRWWHEAPNTGEIFQMHMYAHRLGVSRAALVYPSPGPRSAETRVGGVTIECVGRPLRA